MSKSFGYKVAILWSEEPIRALFSDMRHLDSPHACLHILFVSFLGWALALSPQASDSVFHYRTKFRLFYEKHYVFAFQCV